MKKYVRLLLLLLAAVLALSVFVGCDEADADDYYEEEENDDGEDFFPDVERTDYGMDFNLYMAPSTSVDLYYMDDDKNDGSPMDESVYNRQARVQRYLGIDIAADVYNSGLTLEEYLGITSVYAD